MPPPLRLLLGLALTLLLGLPEASAQTGGAQDPGVRPVTRTYAIVNARVVQGPGRVLPRATVVVRDGLIEAVGPDARVPFDAERIEGDSLVVYAGFVDALAYVGLDVPAVDTQARVPDPDDPPRERAGILPDRLARQHLRPDEPGVEALRRAGFTVAHVAPETGMLSGQGAVILLAGERPEEMVLVPEAALIARFTGGQGVAPATPMGVTARMRQLYREARRQGEARGRMADDPAGLRRLRYDPVSAALERSAAGQQPVFFVAASALEGHRALALAEELGLRPVLAGVPESSPLIDRLRGRPIPVLAPLGLPDALDRAAPADTTALPSDTTVVEPVAPPVVAAEAAPEEDLAAHLGGRIFVTERRTVSYADVEDEAARLQDRRRISVGLYERNALTLQEADVPFAFASMGTGGGDVRGNLRRIVARGLSPEAALAALTTTPAELLGLQRQLGTVEAGKLANLVLTDGDYFSEEARVRYVFVDGRRFEIDAAEAAVDPDAEVTAAGTWTYTATVGADAVSGRLALSGAPEALSGSIEVAGMGTLPLTDVRLAGNRLTFSVPNTPLGTLQASATITGDRMAGEMQAPGQGAIPFSATRRPN